MRFHVTEVKREPATGKKVTIENNYCEPCYLKENPDP